MCSKTPEKGCKLIYAQKCKYKTHINGLEGRELATGMRWMEKQILKIGCRIAVMKD